ncbi:DUF1993 family protein [Pseudomonas sp. M30-35]|uniref:DUF1993 domain-containing protein n=1 Tax=Pseudomonas sp. M30-35 TaxID=1981174 RepID=UPI000B3D41BD|nr:DUF1993 family protein [Pseudomonas sp. M30-35]ARU88222.1 hypothetical protein B9K09_09710 [Pseudomonas sp. M30-35]
MSLSMYQASVPVFVRMLSNLDAILDKALVHAEAEGFDPSVLVSARLAPDMFDMARQIQIATDAAKGCVARLAGVDVPSYADTETSFAQLKQRIAKTAAFVESFNAEQIDGSEDKIINIKLPSRELSFSGQMFLLHFALPNFYFHISTCYAILRHNGVKIGKMDYLGAV